MTGSRSSEVLAGILGTRSCCSRSSITRAMSQFAVQARLRPRASQSRLHGFSHWKSVGLLGNLLAALHDGADPVVAVLFGLFHDLERENDGTDPEHGARAANLVGEIGAHALGLSSGQLTLLESACRHHSDGYCHSDPTVGCCWDADRLTLWRCGITPSVELLSTQPGRSAVMLAMGYKLTRHPPTWRELFQPVGYLERMESWHGGGLDGNSTGRASGSAIVIA